MWRLMGVTPKHNMPAGVPRLTLQLYPLLAHHIQRYP